MKGWHTVPTNSETGRGGGIPGWYHLQTCSKEAYTRVYLRVVYPVYTRVYLRVYTSHTLG